MIGLGNLLLTHPGRFHDNVFRIRENVFVFVQGCIASLFPCLSTMSVSHGYNPVIHPVLGETVVHAAISPNLHVLSRKQGVLTAVLTATLHLKE